MDLKEAAVRDARRRMVGIVRWTGDMMKASQFLSELILYSG